jgi:peptidyl-dipeptidase Dcp
MRACVVASAILIALLPAAALGQTPEASETPDVSASTIDLATHPLTAPWPGDWGGAPNFPAARVEDFEPVLTAAMAASLVEIDTIALNPEPATFENTIAALERAGAPLDRARTVYGVWSSNLNSAAFQEVSRVMSPRFAEHSSKIIQNSALFARIAAVYEGPEYANLTPEQQRVTWLTWNRFVRAGAELDEMSKARVAEVNLRLATLYNTFSDNVLADEENYVTYLTADELGGLPESFVAAAAAAAEARGRPGEYAVTNTRSSMEPFLTYSTERGKREQVWRTYYDRGDNGDAHDNNAIIAETLALRAERAKLLGYPTHAHWRLEVAMARAPEAAVALMESVWPAAIARVAEEVADMQALADAEGAGVVIEPWDYRFYAEKVRAARYAFDAGELRNYLELESLREGMFWSAGELFDLEFTPAPEIPVFHEDVRVWRVTRKSTGTPVGLWYFDPYARAGKRSGAWMSTYRSQNKIGGDGDEAVLAIVSNNANFVKPAPGLPTLISWDDATTLFHEFGHALHALNSDVTYPSVSGTSVARDYVEFPSQLFEHWLLTDEVLSRFARHVETGEPIPADLVAKLKASATFNQGFATTEYLASALVDMRLHLAGATPIDPDAFERETLAELGMPREIVMRHRTPQFNHIFSSDSYSAGYYSYLWADTLTADAAEAFVGAPGGFFDRAVADRLRTNVFATGDTIDARDGFRAFRGRDVDTAALMRKRGFPVPAEMATAEAGE